MCVCVCARKKKKHALNALWATAVSKRVELRGRDGSYLALRLEQMRRRDEVALASSILACPAIAPLACPTNTMLCDNNAPVCAPNMCATSVVPV